LIIWQLKIFDNQQLALPPVAAGFFLFNMEALKK